MALNFPLSLERYLNWETVLPFSISSRYESSVFTYMNMKWKLLSGLKYLHDYYYYYILLLNCDKMKDYAQFSVSTYLQRKGGSPEFKCPTITVNYGFEFLYFDKLSAVNENMHVTTSSNTNSVNITIKLAFLPSTDLFLDVKIEKEDKAIDNPDEDFNCENNDKLPLTVTYNTLPDQSSSEKVSHFQSMSEDLGFMFDKDLMTDVTIKCGEIAVSAHKNILAARSKVFAELLQNEYHKSKNILDNLPIETSILRTFIRYFYTGEIKDLSKDNVLDLYSTSYVYKVQALHDECSNFFAKNLSPENYLIALTLAGGCKDENLKEAVGGFVSDHSSLLATDSWINFSKHSPVLANDIYRKYIEITLTKNVQA